MDDEAFDAELRNIDRVVTYVSAGTMGNDPTWFYSFQTVYLWLYLYL